ncbi:hypothetical protein B0H14DRAFT_3475362 [Mycena olivaceomarginata]|nr:hypothetical protein B0H14DRAFT_3475362 [Mycena olivaceomarginata]
MPVPMPPPPSNPLAHHWDQYCPCALALILTTERSRSNYVHISMYLLSLSTTRLPLPSTYSFVVKLGLPAGRLENKGKGHTGQSHGTVLVKDTCSPDTKGARMQSQPDDGGVRMGSGLNKDDVRLGSGLDKADPRVALDTDKNAGDQARLSPKWACDAGLGMGAGRPDEGSVRMGFDVDKDDVRMGFSLVKDDVRLGSGLDKADPRVVLDTDKDAGDQARLFPSGHAMRGRGAGCCVTPAGCEIGARRAAVSHPQSQLGSNPFVPSLLGAPTASAAESRLVQTKPSYSFTLTLNTSQNSP